MPNWTTNNLYVTGSEELLKMISEHMETAENIFDFNQIVPMPNELSKSTNCEEAVFVFLTDRFSADYGSTAFQQTDNYRMLKDICDHALSYLPERLKGKDDKFISELYDLGRQYISNYRNYGACTWYEWCKRHWGTKWPACDVEKNFREGTLHYRFFTAWNDVHELIRTLSRMYPNAGIEYYFWPEFSLYEYSVCYRNGEKENYNRYEVNYA